MTTAMLTAATAAELTRVHSACICRWVVQFAAVQLNCAVSIIHAAYSLPGMIQAEVTTVEGSSFHHQSQPMPTAAAEVVWGAQVRGLSARVGRIRHRS